MEDIMARYIRSYENFIRFLDDPDILTDYTYLWDIVSMPNSRLFTHGLNLIILDITDDDASDNVSIICPPTQYNSKFGIPTRRHALLIKRGNYYEHIILLKDNGPSVGITRTFSTLYKKLIPTIQEAISFIKKNVNSKCIPNESHPKTYKLSQSVDLHTCLELLTTHKYSIINQVMNYNGKIVGLIVNKGSVTGYLPCLPSGLLSDHSIDILWIEEFKGF